MIAVITRQSSTMVAGFKSCESPADDHDRHQMREMSF
jgi:hypothetical protein